MCNTSSRIMAVENNTGWTGGAHFDCSKPRWESVYSGYPKDDHGKGVSDEEAFKLVGYDIGTAAQDGLVNATNPSTSSAASAIRITVALLMTGMHRCLDATAFKPNSRERPGNIGRVLLQNGFFANVTDLKNWLLNIWGRADVNNEIVDKTIIEKMCGYNGVIIIEPRDNSSYATLWKNYRTVDGDVNAGDRVYFWQLDGYFNKQFNDMNQAAIEGFKIIDEMSRNWNLEIGFSIYTDGENKYRLNGLKIGDYATVGINSVENMVAFIHTHVAAKNVNRGSQDDSFFLSGLDFYAGSIQNRRIIGSTRGIYTYMKHIDINAPRILKAEPLNMTQEELINYVNGSLVTEKIFDCYEKEACYRRFRRTSNTNCRNAARELLVRHEEGTLTGDLSAFIIKINNEGTNFTINTSNCLFGLLLQRGQKVFEVNPRTGTERELR